MNNIYLVGFMGSGKSTVAKELSAKLQRELIDMDQAIEAQESRKIKDIFETDGEKVFRDLETGLVKNIAMMDNKIVSTGGGIVMKSENVQAMKESGRVVFLQANVDHLYKFLKNDTKRPLLQTDDPKSVIRDLLSKREGYYMKATDMIIQCTGKNIQEITSEIVQLL